MVPKTLCIYLQTWQDNKTCSHSYNYCELRFAFWPRVLVTRGHKNAKFNNKLFPPIMSPPIMEHLWSIRIASAAFYLACMLSLEQFWYNIGSIWVHSLKFSKNGWRRRKSDLYKSPPPFERRRLENWKNYMFWDIEGDYLVGL